MTTSVKNIQSEVNSRLTAGGLSSLACCQLQCAQTILNNGIKYSVANLASLPTASCNTGRLAYVESEKKYYWSDGITWSSNFTSTVSILREIWSWGGNATGALGIGNTVNSCSPVREMCSASDWCSVSSGGGSEFKLALKTDGSLWSWGCNACGQLGIGNVLNRCSPVREICSASNWCQAVAGGNRQAFGIKTDGSLWAWGYNQCGSLGLGNYSTRCSPGREFCSANNWCFVASGLRTTAAIKTDGTLWTWGYGRYGILQNGSTSFTSRSNAIQTNDAGNTWAKVQVGMCHMAALKTTGTIHTWGRGAAGELGTGSFCSTGTGNIQQEGSGSASWCDLSVGGNGRHTLAVKTTGVLLGWGYNAFGQLGRGYTGNRNFPGYVSCGFTDWCRPAAGNLNSAGIRTNGSLWVWGSGGNGYLGNGKAANYCTPQREICAFTNWCSASMAGGGSAIRLNSRGFNV